MAGKLKGALCGCGMISEFHLRGWSRIAEVEIVALCDLAIDRASDRRRQFAPGARVYAALDEMLSAEDLDFIDILTIPSLHGEHCRLARQANLHIICQKPLCDNLAAARDLAREMAGYEKIFAVHENHRYRPWFQTVRERLRQGEFGAPSLLRIEHLSAAEPAEPYKNEAVAGILIEYGTHLIDMMRSLLGEPSRVYTRMHHLNPRVRGESLVHAVYEYPECTASISMAWKRAAAAQSSFLLVGNAGEAWYEGSLTRGDSGRLRIAEGERVVLDEPRCPYDDYVESFYLFERECADAMLGRGRIAQTGEENLQTLACTFAAYESAAAARPVEIA